jgi:aryl-alcohol dehydrogenase-like predicted oxidoreductase
VTGLREPSGVLPTRVLGRGGLVVSALGMGCLPLTDFYGRSDRRQAVRTIQRALDLGITLFDTADIYGHGENEELVGHALTGRDEAVVATKCGQEHDRNGQFVRINGRPDYVRRACEASLRRLNIDVIDLYQLHRVDPETPIEETVGAMHELVRAGKVRFLGLSEAQPQDIRRAAAVVPIDTLQSEYSLLERSLEQEVLPLCEQLGIGVLAYAPLFRGLVAGSFRASEELEEGDARRDRYPRLTGKNLQSNLELVATVEEIAWRSGAKPAAIALAWLLSRQPWIVPIPGTRSPRHLEENAKSAWLGIDPDDLDRLDCLIPRGGGATGERYPPGREAKWVSPRPGTS